MEWMLTGVAVEILVNISVISMRLMTAELRACVVMMKINYSEAHKGTNSPST